MMKLFQFPKEYYLKELGLKFPPQKEKDIDESDEKQLLVSLYSAKNLPPRENKDTRCAYCTIALDGITKEFRTHIVSNSLSPCWLTELKINLSNVSKTASITFSIYDWMACQPDELIGIIALPLFSCVNTKSTTYSLVTQKKRK